MRARSRQRTRTPGVALINPVRTPTAPAVWGITEHTKEIYGEYLGHIYMEYIRNIKGISINIHNIKK